MKIRCKLCSCCWQLLLGLSTVVLLLLCSAVSSAEVGSFTATTTTLCNGGTTSTSTTSSSGTASSVSLESGGTYLLSACNVVVTLLTTNTAELQDVAIVVRGGSALPAVMVSSTMVRNLTIDVADVVAVATRTTQVAFFGQVTTAENISVTLRNVQIYNAQDVSIVSLAVNALITVRGLTVMLSNCILSNVTTRGLIVVSGDVAVTAVSSLSITVSSGKYSLTFISSVSGGGVLMHLSYLASLTNAALAARGISVNVSNEQTPGGIDIYSAVVSRMKAVNTITKTHIVVDTVDAAGVLEDDSIRTALAVIRIDRAYDVLSESSITMRNSRFVGQAGSPSCIALSYTHRIESVFVGVRSTTINLIAHGQVEQQTTYAQGVAAAAVMTNIVGSCSRCTVVMTDCVIENSVTNSSVLRNYSAVSSNAVLWYYVSTTSGLNVTIERVYISAKVRYATLALMLSRYAPVIGILVVGVGGFSAISSSIDDATVVMNNLIINSDVVVIPPMVPPSSYPLLMPPLLAVDVSIGFVVSTSNWTKATISAESSRIAVQQLRFLTFADTAVSVGSTSNCNAIYLSNTTGSILFHGGIQLISACIPTMFSMILSQYVGMFTAANVLSELAISIRDVMLLADIRRTRPLSSQIFVTTVCLPGVVTELRIIVWNMTSLGEPTSSTGPVIALSGSNVVRLTAALNDVTGFPLGMVWSNSEAGSTIQSSSILAVSVDASGGGVLAGNVTAVAPVVVTLRNCVLSSSGSGLFGDGITHWLSAAAGGSLSPGVVNASLPSSVFLLQGCNAWNGRPLTLPLARRLLREAQNVPPGAVTVRTEGESTVNCVVTATLELVPPLPLVYVPSMTSGVAAFSMTFSAISAMSSAASVAGIMRLQAAFGSLRVGRRCYQATDDGSGSGSESDEVGSAVFDNPLRISIPVKDSRLQYAAGCVIGNTVLILVAMIVLNLPSAASETKLTRAGASSRTAHAWLLMRHLVLEAVPGHGVVALLLLLTPTVTSAISLSASSNGDTLTVCCGVAGVFFYGVGPLLSVGLLMWRFPLRAVACVAKRGTGCPSAALQRLAGTVRRWLFEGASQWVPCQPSNGAPDAFSHRFHHRFGELFVGYRSGCHWYAVVDVAVPVLTGVLCGLPAGSVPCSLVLEVLLAVSFVACMGSVLLRPCMMRWDNLWAVVGNGFSVAVTALIVSERMSAANTATTVLSWMNLVPTLTKVAQRLYRLFVSMRTANHDRRDDVALSLSFCSLNASPITSLVTGGGDKKNDGRESLALLISLICTPVSSRSRMPEL